MHLFNSIVKLYSDLGGSLVYSCVVSLSFTVDRSVGKQLLFLSFCRICRCKIQIKIRTLNKSLDIVTWVNIYEHSFKSPLVYNVHIYYLTHFFTVNVFKG